jgi:hypothetical protein
MPRSSRVTSDPTTRSRTVLETRISPGWPPPSPEPRCGSRYSHIVLAQLDLAGVQARPQLDADTGQFIAKRGSAVHRSSGAVEGGQDPVAGGLDQPPAEVVN